MKYKFFVGLPHQKIHHRFYQSILRGDYVDCPCAIGETDFPDWLFEHDAEDVIWFFTDIYFNLHQRLKGRQVFTCHGISFKKWAHTDHRAAIINESIDLVFSTGLPEELDLISNGVRKDKIRQVGYTLLFEIPPRPMVRNSILFYYGLLADDHYLRLFINAIENLDDEVHGYLTIHPQNQHRVKDLLIKVGQQKRNLKLLRTQEELLEAFAYCQCCAGGISSVSAPFFFLNKPVIFILPQSRLPGVSQWQTLRQTNHPALFRKVLQESSHFRKGMRLDSEFIKKAKISPSAKKIFYPINFNKTSAISYIYQVLAEIGRKND